MGILCMISAVTVDCDSIIAHCISVSVEYLQFLFTCIKLKFWPDSKGSKHYTKYATPLDLLIKRQV